MAGLAFGTPQAEDAAKVGVLVASGVASALGVTVLLLAGRRSGGRTDRSAGTLPR